MPSREGVGLPKRRTTVVRITIMAFGYRWRMALAIVTTIIAAIFMLVIPQLLGSAINDTVDFLNDAPADRDDVRRDLLITGLLLFGANVARGVFTMAHNYMGESIGQHIGYELRMAFYRKMQRMSYSYHNHVHTGDPTLAFACSKKPP